MTEEFMIKARKRLGSKAWWFVSAKGGLNRLRIHAARYTDRTVDGKTETAQWRVWFAIGELSADNPDYEFKPVKA